MLLSLEKVSKRYGDHIVVREASLKLEAGTVLGLVGRNGSGKTVLLKCISGLVPVTSGRILYKGKEVGQDIDMPDDMGILIESPGYLAGYDGMTNLSLFMSIRRKPDKVFLGSLMEKVGLDPDNRTKVGRYSLGMKQRLGIAMAIMDHPGLLILDEPMNGLDSDGVREMRKLLLSLKEEGTSMILASHIVGDIQTLCDHVAYLEAGEIVRYDEEVIRRTNQHLREE